MFKTDTSSSFLHYVVKQNLTYLKNSCKTGNSFAPFSETVLKVCARCSSVRCDLNLHITGSLCIVATSSFFIGESNSCI